MNKRRKKEKKKAKEKKTQHTNDWLTIHPGTMKEDRKQKTFNNNDITMLTIMIVKIHIT